MLNLSVQSEKWPLSRTFAIARGAKIEAHVVVVEIADGLNKGRGECVPYARYGETVDGVIATIKNLRDEIEAGLSIEDLQDVMEPGAARNAVDCALWDLKAKQADKPVWELAGLDAPQPAVCAETISIDTPAEMAKAAGLIAHKPLLKVKVGGDLVMERLLAVRDAAPQSKLVVDANEGWTLDQLNDLMPGLAKLNVRMIEQPLKAGEDAGLVQGVYPITLCADESCHGPDGLEDLKVRYGMVNIKLDKTGGLTEAIVLARKAKDLGFKIMVGCMVGTSLGMAPAALLSGFADFVDLDGPLWLADDREHGLLFDGGLVHPPEPALWG